MAEADKESPVFRYSFLLITLVCASPVAQASVIQYGDADVLNNTGTYPIDPKTGATLDGLAPNAVTFGAPAVSHGFPFSPSGTDFPGTDQIYVGSVQTATHEGYSTSALRINGPQVLTLNYSSLVPAGSTVATLTLGIAADDFQQPVFGQPFTARINGVVNPALTALLNSLDQSGPQVRFFTIGISPSALLPTNTLTLTIDQGGDGGDGWAVDFLTVGVTTRQVAPVPEPSTLLLFGALALGGLGYARRTTRKSSAVPGCA